MSRRDTIIVAVLVNAGLLMVLFATAMRSDDAEPKLSKAKAPVMELAYDPASPSDDLLEQFVSSVPTLAETEKQQPEEVSSDNLVLALPAPVPVIEKSPVVNQTETQHVVNVTVKKGDFLEKIAKANNTTVATLMRANNLSTTQLKVGQVLQIPLSESKTSAPVAPSLPSQAEYYTVREGDNPWLIASRNKIRLEDLLRINELDDYKAKRLRPGDKLRIR